jgi:hypothetical protein
MASTPDETDIEDRNHDPSKEADGGCRQESERKAFAEERPATTDEGAVEDGWDDYWLMDETPTCGSLPQSSLSIRSQEFALSQEWALDSATSFQSDEVQQASRAAGSDEAASRGPFSNSKLQETLPKDPDEELHCRHSGGSRQVLQGDELLIQGINQGARREETMSAAAIHLSNQEQGNQNSGTTAAAHISNQEQGNQNSETAAAAHISNQEHENMNNKPVATRNNQERGSRRVKARLRYIKSTRLGSQTCLAWVPEKSEELNGSTLIQNGSLVQDPGSFPSATESDIEGFDNEDGLNMPTTGGRSNASLDPAEQIGPGPAPTLLCPMAEEVAVSPPPRPPPADRDQAPQPERAAEPARTSSTGRTRKKRAKPSMDSWWKSNFSKIYSSVNDNFKSFKESSCQPKKIRKVDFLLSLQREVLKKIKGLGGTKASRLGVGQHLPVKLPNKTMKYCKVCDICKGPGNKKGGRSTIECYECRVGLCTRECFFDWHTKKILARSDDKNGTSVT